MRNLQEIEPKNKRHRVFIQEFQPPTNKDSRNRNKENRSDEFIQKITYIPEAVGKRVKDVQEGK